MSKGFNVVVPNYRLADRDNDVTLKDMVLDCYEVLKFIEKHHLYYGLDLSNLFVMGDSAGGHISLLIDAIFNDEEAREFFGIKELLQSKVKGYALNSPMYDYPMLIEKSKKLFSKRNLKVFYSKDYLNEDYIKHLNPRYYFNKGMKVDPLFVSNSYNDFFRTQSYICNKDCQKYDSIHAGKAHTDISGH